MTPLQQTLYDFCLQQRTDQYLSENRKEYEDNLAMARRALDQLEQAGEPWSDLAQRVEYGLMVAKAIEQEAFFLAGLSLSRELEQL